MRKVALVTDSTAYIPPEMVERHGIRVAAQVLVWGDETLRDGIDILPTQFYQRLETAKIMPTTSQASPKAFKEIFDELLESGHEVLAVVISGDLSGTLSSAIQAKEMLPGKPVEVVDSRTTSMALGFIVLEVARAAEKGASLDECKALAERLRDRVGVLFAVDTLEFLHRGGRIGGGARFLGTALNLKPILEVTGGKVESVDKVRTRKKSLSRVIELVEERVQGCKQVHIAAIHANSQEDAQWLLEQVNGRLNTTEKILSTVSPVVGTHAGPGTVGLAFLAEE